MASRRTGRNTGPGRPRRTARPSAVRRMTAATKTAVLARASATVRPGPGRTVGKLRIRERRSPFRALLQLARAADPREPSALESLDRAVSPETVDRPVRARPQRVALLEDESETLSRAACRQLADDRSVGHLNGGHEEGRREIDHDSVDLSVLQRLDCEVVRVVGPWCGGRSDESRDVVVARRSELSSEPVGAEGRDRAGPRDLSPPHADDGLVHEVVGLGEVDDALPLGGKRDLRDVEVERLPTGPE